MEAQAAAAQTGLPVWVEVISPGPYWSITSCLPISAETGSELEIPFPQQTRSGTMP